MEKMPVTPREFAAKLTSVRRLLKKPHRPLALSIVEGCARPSRSNKSDGYRFAPPILQLRVHGRGGDELVLSSEVEGSIFHAPRL
jgi:hypothetical protein